MLKGATGTTPLPYPTLIPVILRHFGVSLADEYNTTIDGHNFEIGQSLLHRASIVYAAENWYIQELGIEGNRPKENYPDIDPEDLPEPDPDPLPPHFQQLSLQFSQIMDAKFEQQRQYIDQQCDQMETALRGEITSLREEIARSNSTFVPPYSQTAFPAD
jgi:hypothetical protein